MIGMCLVAFPAVCRFTSKYRWVRSPKSHFVKLETGITSATSYDVSVKVGNAIYVAVYTPPLGENTLKYAAGRDLLVLVGKTTIAYNDLLGRSFAVPIESQLQSQTV